MERIKCSHCGSADVHQKASGCALSALLLFIFLVFMGTNAYAFHLTTPPSGYGSSGILLLNAMAMLSPIWIIASILAIFCYIEISSHLKNWEKSHGSLYVCYDCGQSFKDSTVQETDNR